MTPCALFLSQGETKADDSSNKDASEEKQEEDSDYHRSDEQVGDAGCPLALRQTEARGELFPGVCSRLKKKSEKERRWRP